VLIRRFRPGALFMAVMAAVLLLNGLLSFPAKGETMMQTESIPRPEHPRPDFWRSEWLNLNGTWEFQIDPNNEGEALGWFAPEAGRFERQIVVPFPWQSDLSGVAIHYAGVAWYRRMFTIPDWGAKRVWLNFGAVDYEARVWVNGQLVGEHEGAYTPFAFDITDALHASENTLVVRVEDPANLYEIPHGKQSSNPPNPWDDCDFSTSSGLWQTVWLEARPESYIRAARVTPDVPGARAVFDVEIVAARTGDYSLEVTVTSPSGQSFTQIAQGHADASGPLSLRFEVPIATPELWDIRTPNLYDVTLTLNGADVLHTYFGMRSIETRDGQVLLNGRPIYLMTALDQGYWPGGIFTAPTDEALRVDIELALRLGLNGLREHIKIEDPRFAYWADQLGLLLWNDAPSPVLFNDLTRERLTRDMQGMILRDYNHPSIIIWSPYNESWGLEFRSDQNVQTYLAALYDQIKAWDPTRLVVDNSGWRHVRTDIADLHRYTDDPIDWRGILNLLETDPDSVTVLQHPFYALGLHWAGEPLMMSEYGTGWIDDRSWSFKWQTNELRRHAQIVGYTYTELYDIEHERAGFLLYDRTPKDAGYDFAMFNSEDFIVLDGYRLPTTLKPGDSLEVPVYISAYGQPEWSTGRVHWRLAAVTPEANTPPLLEGEFAASFAPYSATQVESIMLTVPDTLGPVQLWAEIVDGTGNTRARNYLDFEVFSEPLPRQETTSDDGVSYHTLRFSPGDDWSAVEFRPVRPGAGPSLNDTHPIFAARDTGYVEYRLSLPAAGMAGVWQALTLSAEVASRPADVVQAVEGRTYPTDVTVSVNGVELTTWAVPDRPVNSGGALMRLNGLGAGEHGYWMQAQASEAQLAEIQVRAEAEGVLLLRFEVREDAAHRGGLSLFGARSGRYGRDPFVSLAVRQP